MYDIKRRMNFSSHLSTGAASGIITGVLVSIWESFVIVATSGELTEIWLIPYGIILYGLVCGIIGLMIGVAGSVIDRLLKIRPKLGTGFLIYFSFMFLILSFIVGRYRYFQIILGAAKGLGVLDYSILLAAVIVGTAIITFVWKIFSGLGPVRAMSGLIGACIWFVILVMVSLATAGIYGTKTVNPPGKPALASQIPGTNVILIIVDTLRHDRLSINGYTKHRTPNFDALASDAINFTTCVAQSSWTKPQIATILTSLYASSHKAMSKADILPDAIETIAEVFSQKGYYTIGIADNVNIAEAFNFQQGYDEYYFLKPEYYFHATESAFKLSLYGLVRAIRATFFANEFWPQHFYQPGEVVNDKAMALLETIKQKRFFMLIHYMDPHDPFFVHKSLGRDSYTGVGYARAANQDPPASVAGLYSDTYDGEVLYYDDMLGELVQYLKKNSLYDSTIIVLTSDHGEEFYEHNNWWHGYTLYEEGIRVALMIKPVAETFQPHIDTTMVRSLDIAPTILGLAGIDPPPSWQGENLFMRTAEPEYIFSEEELSGNDLLSVRGREWKYIKANPENGRGLKPQELYRISEDPLEKNNVAELYPEKVAELDQLLKGMKQLAAGQSVAGHETELDAVTRERLKALGYIK